MEYANAADGGGPGREMESGMAVSLRESLSEISDPRNLDASVEEVFQMMLGVELPARSEPPCRTKKSR